MRFALVVLLLACGSSEPPRDGDLVDQWFASNAEIATPTCDCFAEEYPSYEECLTGEAYVDVQPCTRTTYDSAPVGALDETMTCLIGVNDAFIDCIRGVGCDVDAWAACYEEGNDLIDPCLINPDAQAETDALFACFPGDF